ncbi:hypothetical protein [Nannocystis punicea]|uniref:SIR2-like domain-containing protein n=1 Tax=Nannocystis punicea TaxID=2995304 RepID=A0ABY7HB90_9BACT|nr:hypothetical protein [Nannocystis poenicansa]WAS96370.1 hypothetical protein O0S08_09435 [Nannocystis poenicansa]
MSIAFADEEDLLGRLTDRPENLVYLVGSPISASNRTDTPGVPGVVEMIERVRAEFSGSALQRLDAKLTATPTNKYQAAFLFLQQNKGQDAVNRIIQRAVLRARRESTAFPVVPNQIDSIEHCRALENDYEGWHLAPAVEALGRIIVSPKSANQPVVLTPNFDPLIKASIRRAGGQFHTIALHGDGSLPGFDGQGCLVVHFHGDWYRTDTLHTPAQLGQERPMLSASLARLIHTRTLVVLAYSGWDDIFQRAMIGALRSGLATFDVLWTFFPTDQAIIERDFEPLLKVLQPGIDRGRVVPYKGIDVHTLLPRLAEKLAAMRVSEVATAATVRRVPTPPTPPTRSFRVGDRVRSTLNSDAFSPAGGLVTKVYPDHPELAQVQYSERPPTDYNVNTLELDERLLVPLQPNIDIPRLAGRFRGQVEAVLGMPVRHESVSPSKMGPALKCWYREGWVEVVYHNGLSDWITVSGLGDIAFAPESLPKFGFPATSPSFQDEHVIRWLNLGEIREISLFSGQGGASDYLYVKTLTS